MSDKEPVVDEATQAGEYIAEEQGERRATLLAGIEEALVQVERGETYTVEEMLGFVKEWAHE